MFKKKNNPYEIDTYLETMYDEYEEVSSSHNVPEYISNEFKEKLQNYKNDNSCEAKEMINNEIFKILRRD